MIEAHITEIKAIIVLYNLILVSYKWSFANGPISKYLVFLFT
jgi:hypothetical protein